jgi:nucleoside-diphosphate-sugar epimerase
MINFGVLPITDIENLAASFRVEFQELEETDFIIVGATGFLGKWLSTYLAFLQSNSMIKGTLTLVVRDLGKLAELGDIPNLAKCKVILSNSISKTSFSHLGLKRVVVIYGATSTSITEQISKTSTGSVTSLAREILTSISTNSVTFVHLSSGGVYLPEARQLDAIPGDFEVQTKSNDPYTFEKLALERWTISENEKKQCVGRNPRLFTFYGPGLQLDRHFAIADFMRCGLQGKPIIVKGNPGNLRSYLYPTDAVKQILKQSLMATPHFSQIGSTKATTILNVAQLVANEFGVGVEILDSRISRKDNYVPQDVPTMLEIDFSYGISQWAKWLKSGFRGNLIG